MATEVKHKLIFDPPELGCVLYLPGLPQGGGTIRDLSPYGNHGAITGATWTRLPSGLWCLSFDGNNYITVPDNDCLSFGNGVQDSPFSLEAWIKLDVGGATSSDIFNKNSGTIFEYYFAFDNQRHLHFSLWDEISTAYITAIAATTDMVAYEGQWVYVATTYDGSSTALGMKVYLKGIDVTSYRETNLYTAMHNTTVPFYISRGFSWGLLEGIIALPRVYRRKLSNLELQNHFRREKHLFGVW